MRKNSLHEPDAGRNSNTHVPLSLSRSGADGGQGAGGHSVWRQEDGARLREREAGRCTAVVWHMHAPSDKKTFARGTPLPPPPVSSGLYAAVVRRQASTFLQGNVALFWLPTAQVPTAVFCQPPLGTVRRGRGTGAASCCFASCCASQGLPCGAGPSRSRVVLRPGGAAVPALLPGLAQQHPPLSPAPVPFPLRRWA